MSFQERRSHFNQSIVISIDTQQLAARSEVLSCRLSKISPNPRATADEISCTARLFLTAKQLFLRCRAAEPEQELFHSVPVLNGGFTRRFIHEDCADRAADGKRSTT